MSWADLKLATDFAGGYLAGRLLWLAVSEMAIKPLLFHWYGQLDRALKDRLPNIQ